jgi:hypothetical protein
MILQAILDAFVWLIEHTIFAIIPDFGPASPAITSGGDWLLNNLGNAIAIIYWALSPPLAIAISTVLLAVFLFEFVYHPIMWIIKKLPFLGIK